MLSFPTMTYSILSHTIELRFLIKQRTLTPKKGKFFLIPLLKIIFLSILVHINVIVGGFMIKKYIKRPVVVDAYQTEQKVLIHTLEGDMLALPGDYIITGVDGEQYPCKAEIFAKTYLECK